MSALLSKVYDHEQQGETTYIRSNKKAFYGLLRFTLLFYRKLVKDLEAYEFQINPYDLCVTNKMINDKQMTTVWNVVDLKVSHVD